MELGKRALQLKSPSRPTPGVFSQTAGVEVPGYRRLGDIHYKR